MMAHVLLNQWISVVVTGLALFLCAKTGWNLFQAHRTQKQYRNNLFLVETIRPLVFLKIFAISLYVSFFPQYLMHITIHSGWPESATSILYVMYQLTVILMIVPGGYLVEVKNIKRILMVTTFTEALLLVTFGLSTHFWQIVVIQILFGLLVPISSASEHAYILQLSSEKERSTAFSLYYNSLKGAMLAGIALGGSLSLYTGERGVFLVAGAAVLVATLYVFFCVPNLSANQHGKHRLTTKKPFNFIFVLKALPRAFRNMQFSKITILIGLTLGILNDGVILFGMPLILWKHHVPRDQIGQILVLFTIGFFITNKTISRKADEWKADSLFLSLGLLGLGISFFVLAHFGNHNQSISMMGLLILMLGLLLSGMFRGFLLSTGLSAVSKNAVTRVIGKNVAMSIFNFFQTLGTIIGPLFMMFLFNTCDYSSKAFNWVGGIFIAFFLLFILRLSVRNE
ncbi:MAG: MFS transporter [Gammaproteobacteria bacterium]|nr:MFS transporter [Gammaproteobacteria bacterium]MBU2545965.1 MFS transporter [Gammaproteobacteria bacterium]